MKIISIITLSFIVCYYVKMICIDDIKNSKISFKEIILKLDFLKNSDMKLNKKDFLIFLIFPISIGLILVYEINVEIRFDEVVVNILGIISAILLNFWVMLLSVEHRRKDLIEELSDNIVMNVLSTFLMMILFLFKNIVIIEINSNIIKILKVIYIFLIIFSVINFLMILQRMFLIIKFRKK